MSENGPIWAVGAMSGTSLDGVDAAMVLTDGVSIFGFGDTDYRPYSDDERAVLRQALGQVSGAAFDIAAEIVENAHAELLCTFEEVEIAGFHGQTTFHAPDRGITCQAGSGDILSQVLDVPVAWDFRSTDVELGGQGAPLAPFYHHALALYLNLTEPTVFLNIGGVSNLTWVDPEKPLPELPGACLAFDAGPGNAKIDDLILARRGARMDKDGALTRAGQVDEAILAKMLERRGYFSKLPPKSLDRDDFSDWSDAVASLSDADAVATLAAGTAGAIAHGMQHCPSSPAQVLVCGGGRKNPGLMEMLAALLPCPVKAVEEVGLDGDMLEAQAFAYLAVRLLYGMPTSAPGTTGVPAPVGGGRISKLGLGNFNLRTG